jgi:hypothetical protein
MLWWREGLIVVFVVTYFMWQFHIMRRNRMVDQCKALTLDGEQCTKPSAGGNLICCVQHNEIVYAGPKRLQLVDGDDRDPYAEGADAGSDNNPYPLTSNQALAWNDGFNSAHPEGDEDE